ncbi:hypothetical protein [Peribacillus sp. SCS-37]|uniref:hypothetical protein n=1 Tax=Paraperibacillus esterisolvens TaxID=3115296 RepID=UPI0039068823
MFYGQRTISFLWSGLTLRFVDQRSIIIPYIFFFLLAVCLEGVLCFLIGAALYFSFSIHSAPDWLFLFCAFLHAVLTIFSIYILKDLYKIHLSSARHTGKE